MMTALRFPTLAIAVLLLAACTAPPPAEPAPPPLTTATPEDMVQAIRAAAGADERELAVQPLRDPMVDDLREQAEVLLAAGRYDEAAEALDHALELVEGDPALLQERAEVALLQRRFEQAGALAERAHALGAQVGPLCRRHWVTIEQVRLLAADAEGAALARAQVDGCKVVGPDRF